MRFLVFLVTIDKTHAYLVHAKFSQTKKMREPRTGCMGCRKLKFGNVSAKGYLPNLLETVLLHQIFVF